MSSATANVAFLVVCGAISVADDRLFGYFIGFAKALKKLGIEGENWSSFPLGDYFAQGIYTDINFETKSDTDWSAREVYTKSEYNHRGPFWRQFPSGQTHNRAQALVPCVERYISQTATQLKAGDVFNIILIGHEDDEGINLGGEAFCAAALADRLDHLTDGVQANIVLEACQSGTFLDNIQPHNQPKRLVHASTQAFQPSTSETRSPSYPYRNSKFTAAFLDNFGLITPRTRGQSLPQ